MSLWARNPCVACGEPVAPGDRRCAACGAKQPDAPATLPEAMSWEETLAAPPPPAEPAPPPPPERAAIVAASVAGANAAILAAFGMVIVIVFAAVVITALPFDHSIVQFHGSGLGFAHRVLLQVGQLVQAPFDATSAELGISAAVQAAPLLSLILPIGTAAVVTRHLSPRLAVLPPAVRLAWGAAAGVPFTVLMVILALLSRTSITRPSFTETFEVAPDTVFALSLLWGALGGLAGAYAGLARDERPRPHVPAPIRAAVTHLGIALALSTILVTAVVAVQTARDAGHVRAGRSPVGAVIEDAAFAAEHGIHGLQLGMLGEFRSPGGELIFLGRNEVGLVLPVPTTKFLTVLTEPEYRISAFRDALPGSVFVVTLILLVGLPGVLCVRAGWVSARATPGPIERNALAGAVVGPVWAVAITLLGLLANKTDAAPYWGLGDAGGTFFAVLLFAGLLGALGGAAVRPGDPAPGGAEPPARATS